MLVVCFRLVALCAFQNMNFGPNCSQGGERLKKKTKNNKKKKYFFSVDKVAVFEEGSC